MSKNQAPKFGVCPICGSLEELLPADPNPRAYGYVSSEPDREEHNWVVSYHLLPGHLKGVGRICSGILAHPVEFEKP